MGWKLYDHMIEGIPAEVRVTDHCLGLCWSYVEAECGMGVAYTCRGGATTSSAPADLRGMPLRDVAALAKSWRFEEATLGIAALNAWYSQPRRVDALGARYDEPVELPDGTVRKQDAFEVMRPRVEAFARETGRPANVVVVGHFPHVDRIAEYANLTVLERTCRDGLDTPDPACEYVMPEADFAFITGVTLENKTAPRLLELAKGAHVCMVGPSVVMAPALLEAGVSLMAGSVVHDPDRTRHAVKAGNGQLFGKALQMVTIDRQ